MVDINGTIALLFPKAVDCLNGHLGPEVESVEEELADDRTYQILVVRCGHCHMPLRDEYL